MHQAVSGAVSGGELNHINEQVTIYFNRLDRRNELTMDEVSRYCHENRSVGCTVEVDVSTY